MKQPSAKKVLCIARQALLCVFTAVLVFLMVVGIHTSLKGDIPHQNTGATRVDEDSALRTPPKMPALRYTSASEDIHAAYTDHGAFIVNTSMVSQGYLLAYGNATKQGRLVLQKGGAEYIDPLPTDGQYYAYPLSMNDGAYQASIHLLADDGCYYSMLEVQFTAVIENALQHFLVPTPLAWFDETATVARVAQQLYREADSDEAFVSAVFQWVRSVAHYDEAASEISNWRFHVPDLERVITDGTAICTDFAALFCAALRACGVPCQLVYGNVTTLDGTQYHAWNMVWLTDAAGTGAWWRYDPTFGFEKMDPNAPAEPIILRGQPQYGVALYTR